MGNSASKQAKIDEIVSVLSEKSDQTSERESSSTWYRYGVEITDVYDVIEILGQGHMGEVFTVRRKTTGHHTEVTKEGLKRELMEREEQNNKLSSHHRKNSLNKFSTKKKDDVTSFPGAEDKNAEDKGKSEHGRKSSFGNIHFSRKKSGDGPPPPTSPGSSKHTDSKDKNVTKSPRVKEAVHKVKDKIKSKIGGSDDVEADARLGEYLNRADTSDSVHEPPCRTAKPAKSIMKSESDVLRDSTGGNESIGDIGIDISKLNLDTIVSTNPPVSSGNTESKDAKKAAKGVHFQRTFAVKTILTSRINKEQVQEMVNEIMIMRKLDHPYVLKLYEVYHVKRESSSKSIMVLNLLRLSNSMPSTLGFR